ncbi:MAG TPA: HAMP domain-containing protein [Anaerolineales bacterium]|nr:HAMP domain-containing protein [Anaerolineae bacterium]HIP87445.1 HAMP domain-containing protein [Anaerolineales bacterium]
MSRVRPLEVPGPGMRGGLGRTLLTAFLVLAIFPLSVVSWYATNRSRLNIQHQVTEKLLSIAALKEVQITRWTEETRDVVDLLMEDRALDQVFEAAEAGEMDVARQYLTEATSRYALLGTALLSKDGRIWVSTTPSQEGAILPVPEGPVPFRVAFSADGPNGGVTVLIVVPLSRTGRWQYLSVWPDPAGPLRILRETAGLGQTGEIYLVDREGKAFPQGQVVESTAVEEALAGADGEGLYENYAGVPVIGVYRWLPSLSLALLVEQSQEEAFAGNDAVAAAVIMATLTAALAAAVVSAVVTRQITRPIVRLTKSALRIADGDLSQRVEINSRDEIGILGQVFNRMAAELESLYNDLEAKVAERTRLLQQANYQIQRRAIQMQASLEVGRAVTSILDPDRLLEQVVRLVRDRFVYSYAAVYTLEGEELVLRASAGEPAPFHGEHVPLDDPGPLARVLQEGEAIAESRPVLVTVGPPADYVRSEVLLPLRRGETTIGVLDVQTTAPQEIDQDEVSVLQNVAYQIAIALENARAYALEREAAKRLRELDRSKRRFLANMSHELRTPLTNIIGFTRLLLKGIDGPLTEQQRQDLEIIYHNSQHLLGLINDLLDLSQIEAGLMELQFREVDLAELIRSVMATTSALVRGKKVTLREEIAPDLPLVRADPARIRQVLLRLMANAAKYTDQGRITVRAWASNGQVLVSVSDTGVGIPPEDLERIFERFEQGGTENGHLTNGAGLGLSLSKEFVEMHGGRIWVESRVGKGSTFTFSLPLRPPDEVTGEGKRGAT